MLLRDVVWLGIASKLTLLSLYTTLRCVSFRFASTLPPLLGAKAERRQSGGKVETACVPTVYYIIPKKPKIRVPLLRKKSGTKVALDDNNNYNRDEVTVHTPFHKLYGKHNARQLYTFRCSLFTVKCNEFGFLGMYIIWYY